MNHNNPEDNVAMREILKMEHNADIRMFNGKSVKYAKSTSGGELDDFTKRVEAWMEEQGYQTELLNPKEYKKWRDTIRPFGGPANYIDYLLESKKLKPYYNKTV